MICTKLFLGTRETPKYVSEDFYNCVKMACVINQFDHQMHPDTVRYFVPSHQVVERPTAYQEYVIEVDDETLHPRCVRRSIIKRETMKFHFPSHCFDRVDIYYEDQSFKYFLLLPSAGFYHTEIWTQWDTSFIEFEGLVWLVDFRRVYTDPHDTNHSIWYSGKPKYQIQITCRENFQDRPTDLKRSLAAILPRAFRWTTASGAPL